MTLPITKSSWIEMLGKAGQEAKDLAKTTAKVVAIALTASILIGVSVVTPAYWGNEAIYHFDFFLKHQFIQELFQGAYYTTSIFLAYLSANASVKAAKHFIPEIFSNTKPETPSNTEERA